MPKYIDADALLKEAKKISGPFTGDGWDNFGVYALIERQPAADVEPVVRCRDCKFKPTAPDGITHGFQVEFPDEEHNLCPCQCEDGWYSWMPPDDFFCAHGAKMDGEGENE